MATTHTWVIIAVLYLWREAGLSWWDIAWIFAVGIIVDLVVYCLQWTAMERERR